MSDWRDRESTVYCPSCGAEYRAGVPYCSECRVALVPEEPSGRTSTTAEPTGGYVRIGAWPRLSVQILRSRLESAGISVMVEWSGSGTDGIGTLVVPIEQSEFAEAVVHEIDVDDEVPDTSPHAYVVRLEEHLAAAAELLQELRTRLDELEAEREIGVER